jgi:ATP-dependent Zn protease
VILTLFATTLLHDYYLAAKVETISYSKFKELVGENKVGNLTLGLDRIRGVHKEPKAPDRQFVTVRVNDPELVKLLDEKKISYSGSVENKWLPALLSWLLPIGLLILFWSFMMRRMGSGAQGVLSIGKAKAKIYAEKEIGVTFDDVAGIDEAKAELEEGRGRRGGGPLLQHERVGVRGDVRGRGRVASPRPVLPGEEERAVHHLRRRARRPGQGPRPEPHGRAR